MNTKRCCRGDKCLTGNPEQPLENFSKRKASKDGLSYTCKTCERATSMESYHRRKKSGQRKAYYLNNREKLLSQARVNYEENKEARLAQCAEYRKNNPEVWRRADKRRRQRLKQVEKVPYTRDEIIARDSVDGIPICQICFKPVLNIAELDLDHIIPLDLGGADAPDNVRVAHHLCNIRRPKDGRDELKGDS